MNTIKRIFFLISFAFLYFIVKEFLSLYLLLRDASPILGYLFILGSVLFIIYFAVIPIYDIFKLSQYNAPVKDVSKIDELRGERINAFKENKFLLENGFKADLLQNNDEDYYSAIEVLSAECSVIRKRHINKLFYRTSISQNGFIDGMMILSASFMLIKDIFTLYNGRANNFALLGIAKRIYFSVLIGGTEGVEYASHEIYTKLATDTLKKIPFIDKIITSLTDGFTNAVLLTRVALITENYCKLLYVEDNKELIPNPAFIIHTALDITSDALNKIRENLVKFTKGKTKEVFDGITNPVILVFDKTTAFVSDTFAEKRKGKRFFSKT